jgi:2,3-bisphosphoglycerate-independent phosphoglycerate mutase
MKGKKSVLIILDGWGHGDKSKSDAIHYSNTPFISSLYNKYPNCELLTHGENVGLPRGQVGNSEVGHLNIGAGRIVYQDLEKINIACQNNSIAKEKSLKNSFNYAKSNNKSLHIIGLVSDGGVHSHINHLYKLCELAQISGVKKVFVHAFTDGRDVDPKSGLGFISKLQKKLLNSSIKLASVCGRYYSMDRDNRWERIKLAYDALVNGVGIKSNDLLSTIKECYNNGTTDEFLKPIIVTEKNDEPIAKIKDDDVVLFFNFRTDRGRQLTQALCQSDFTDQNMLSLNLHYVTMTNYDQNFKNIQVVFDKENIDQTLGEVLEKNGKTQLRIAETEKYPHVTFFFSGGREKPFIGEKRILKNSPKVATYDLKPEMSAYELK